MALCLQFCPQLFRCSVGVVSHCSPLPDKKVPSPMLQCGWYDNCVNTGQWRKRYRGFMLHLAVLDRPHFPPKKGSLC